MSPEADVWLDCPHPGTAAVLFDGIHPRARFVDTLWQLAWAAPDLAAFVLATLRWWRVAPEEVGVVEGIPGHDRTVYSLLEHELPGARFYPFDAVWVTRHLAAR